MASMAPVATASAPTSSTAPAAPSGEPVGAGTSPTPVSPSVPIAASAPAPPVRLPTMGSQSSIVLPVSGPSRRTLLAAGVVIASLGIALGAVIGWRALAGSRAAEPPETSVGLVERPTLLPHADGGTDAASTTGAAGGGGSNARTARGAAPRPRPTTAGATPATGDAAVVAAVTPTPSTALPPSPGTPDPSPSVDAPSVPPTAPAVANARTSAAAPGSPAHPPAAHEPTPAVAPGPAEPLPTPSPDLPAPSGPSVAGYREGEATDATGTIDPNAFQFVYRHYRPQISACHSEATRGGQEVVGTMRVRVRLGTTGHVVRTRVLANTTNNTQLATCVTNTVQTWHYPAPEGGEVEFDYNFGFGN